MATIRDVAERANVSTATVSRALHGSPGVGPDTRRRVEAAARALHYRPSAAARSLKLRATRTLGLIVTDIENPYFPQLIRAVEDAARLRGYSVLLADGRRDLEREVRSLELLAERQVDGLLLASSALTARHRRWIAESPCPVVVLNGESPVASVAAVLSDNQEGGRLAAEHLLELGHRHVCYIAAAETDSAAVGERLAGARGAFARRGLEGELRVVEGDARVDGGEAAAREALLRWPETTGLLCYNDLTAIGAHRAIHALGRRIPADVSLVGFDDIDMARYVDPPLTTVRQATEDMAERAMRILLDDLGHGEVGRAPGVRGSGPAPRVSASARAAERVPVRLVVRASTGPVAARRLLPRSPR